MQATERDIYTLSHNVGFPNKERFHRHMNNKYEILYFVRGDAEYIIESSVYKLRPRDLLFIRPRTFHYLIPSSSATYERFVANFSLSRIPSELMDFAMNAREIYRIPKGHTIDLMFENFISAKRVMSGEELEIFKRSYIEQILLFLKHLEAEDDVHPVRTNPTLDKILHYIDGHPEEKMTAETFSARFFMSTSWITHTFKETLGVSLMTYVNKKRVLYAQELIRVGTAPTEAAKTCNFDSYVTFYRQYKKIRFLPLP